MVNSVLITGGAGFIGRNLASYLISRGDRVRILDNFNSQIHDINSSKSIPKIIEIFKGDIQDKDIVQKALDGVTQIVHYAAETGTGQSMYEIEKYFSVNIQGTANLINCIQNDSKSTLKSIIVASSRSIYGEGLYCCDEHGYFYPVNNRGTSKVSEGHYDFLCPNCNRRMTFLPTPETAALNPQSFYAVTKLTQEKSKLLLAKNKGINGFALRYQNVYGPGQSLKNPYTGILAIFSTLARQNLPINIFEDGKESRDFIYIDDVVESTVRCLEYKDFFIGSLNVGFGKSEAVLNVANKIKSYYGSKSEITVTGDYRKGDIRHNVADITQLKKLLNFTPLVSFDEGLLFFLSWVDKQPIYELPYVKSIKELESNDMFIKAVKLTK